MGRPSKTKPATKQMQAETRNETLELIANHLGKEARSRPAQSWCGYAEDKEARRYRTQARRYMKWAKFLRSLKVVAILLSAILLAGCDSRTFPLDATDAQIDLFNYAHPPESMYEWMVRSNGDAGKVGQSFWDLPTFDPELQSN